MRRVRRSGPLNRFRLGFAPLRWCWVIDRRPLDRGVLGEGFVREQERCCSEQTQLRLPDELHHRTPVPLAALVSKRLNAC